MGETKTDAEKQATRDTRNERRRDARAESNKATESGMVEVGTLTPGDSFSIDGVCYILTSRDEVWGHVHADILEKGGAKAIDYKTQVIAI